MTKNHTSQRLLVYVTRSQFPLLKHTQLLIHVPHRRESRRNIIIWSVCSALHYNFFRIDILCCYTKVNCINTWYTKENLYRKVGGHLPSSTVQQSNPNHNIGSNSNPTMLFPLNISKTAKRQTTIKLDGKKLFFLSQSMMQIQVTIVKQKIPYCTRSDSGYVCKRYIHWELNRYIFLVLYRKC